MCRAELARILEVLVQGSNGDRELAALKLRHAVNDFPDPPRREIRRVAYELWDNALTSERRAELLDVLREALATLNG